MSTDRLTFRVTLPITKVEAEVRLMYGYDEMEIVKSQKNKVRNKDLNSAITDNLKRVVVALNGIEDRNQIETFLEKMPASDARFLRKAVAQLTPTTKMLLDFDCSSCSHNDELEVPITATFFWPDL